LDVGSDVTEVELRSGMEELKRRLERLLGEKPATPVDASQQRAVEEETQRIAARRDKVAAAGGELLGAAIRLLGELIDTGETQPPAQAVDRVRAGLAHCAEREDDGRIQLKFALPNEDALNGLATTLAKLLVASEAEQ
jgi:hypothetical protein